MAIIGASTTGQKLLGRALLAPLLLFCYGVRSLGLRALGGAGRGLGGLLRLLGFRRRIVRENMRLALGAERSPEEIDALERSFYGCLGTTFLEIARNFALSQDRMREELCVEEADRRRLQELLSRGKGVVLVSGHIANWELLAMGMAAHGFPVSVVVKKQSSPVSQVVIERQRTRTGMEIIYAGGTIEKMRAALGRNRVIGFMVDQNITGPRGVRCNFFGVPAASIRALGALVRDTGAAVVPICAFRESDGRHRVRLLPGLPYLTAPEIADPEERRLREEWLNAQQYQSAIESLVRLHPEQWLWIHRRWKTRRDPLETFQP